MKDRLSREEGEGREERLLREYVAGEYSSGDYWGTSISEAIVLTSKQGGCH